MIHLKILILSSLWTAGWSAYFDTTNAAVNATNIVIALGPSILYLLWFLLFVGDD